MVLITNPTVFERDLGLNFVHLHRKSKTKVPFLMMFFHRFMRLPSVVKKYISLIHNNLHHTDTL